ncbi:KEOPS complex subunit Cgi121 [Methanofollis fontis]|uniref:Kinase binding protein CGI-121 n=1 Tax=Methanofollis fontis TaxID=2052832 RepID=A0A483CRQ2_9EURY|nr:KEOPS complex subunit Cgi121 [Methanofollis fontis]TAJ45508.1 hypothetical protein CUJ86_01915 [Methanofollis fontis]
MSECRVLQAVIEIPSLPAFLSYVRRIGERNRTHIIFLDAGALAGRRHAEKAVRQAVRSWQEGRAIANSLEMEALLYAAGTRQCRVAAEIGLHEGENHCYVCLHPPSEEAEEALGPLLRWSTGDWEEIDDARRQRLMERYGITAEELDAAGGRILPLVLERVAMLDVNR